MAKPTHARVQALPEHEDATKEFLRLVSFISSREGWREYDTFRTWLRTAFHALRNPTLKHDQAQWDKNEESYMRIVSSCKKPTETMSDFAMLLAYVKGALRNNPSDMLGPIFSEVCANAGMGQFFTPYCLSKTIAMMTLHDAPEILAKARAEGRDYLSIQEPACGVGGMVLAANEVLREQGIDIERNVHWSCIDIDAAAVYASFVQLSLTGVNAVVYHGSALDDPSELKPYPTLTALLHPCRLRPVETPIQLHGLRVRHRARSGPQPPAQVVEAPQIAYRVRARQRVPIAA